MIKKVTLIALLGATAACNTTTGNTPFQKTAIDCTQTQFQWEYEKISCQADKEKAERLKKTFEGAVVGAGLGAIVASVTNEDPKKAIIAGALIAGLGVHWQSAQKEMELRELSEKQRERYLNRLAIKKAKETEQKMRALRAEAEKIAIIQDEKEKSKRLSEILTVAKQVEAEAERDFSDSAKIITANGGNKYRQTERTQIRTRQSAKLLIDQIADKGKLS